MNAIGVSLSNRPRPTGLQRCIDLLGIGQPIKIFRVLNVLTHRGEYLFKLAVRRLEDAEGSVHRSVDYLDILNYGLFYGRESPPCRRLVTYDTRIVKLIRDRFTWKSTVRMGGLSESMSEELDGQRDHAFGPAHRFTSSHPVIYKHYHLEVHF